MRTYGLALCGGGGKGAFQIGVWKALEETGYWSQVKAVSGNSIGGLNAVLFGLGDFRQAKRIWYSVREDMVFSPKKDGDWRLFPVFSRAGLQEILDSLDLSALARSPVEVYVNIWNVRTMKVESRMLNHLPVREQRELLLATSALPVIYDKVRIRGEDYLDGGMGILEWGNVPVEPLYRQGYRDIIVSSLEQDLSPGNLKKVYPDGRFTVVVPMENLGDFVTGTLDFSQTGIRNRMTDGYRDALKQLRKEDVYFMKNNYSKINVQLRNQMTRMFSSGAELERFIKTTNFSNLNTETWTLGGKVFYTDVVELFGWKVQQHNVPGLQSHYRILDDRDVRRAWVMDPEDILRALDDYETVEKFDRES